MIEKTHVLPGIKTYFTVQNRQELDLIHHVLRGNKKFVIMKNKQEMRGFVLELKRTHQNLGMVAEVEGIDRFQADSVYIPQDRTNLYLNESDALHFANGKIISDKPRTDFSN